MVCAVLVVTILAGVCAAALIVPSLVIVILVPSGLIIPAVDTAAIPGISASTPAIASAKSEELTTSVGMSASTDSIAFFNSDAVTTASVPSSKSSESANLTTPALTVVAKLVKSTNSEGLAELYITLVASSYNTNLPAPGIIFKGLDFKLGVTKLSVSFVIRS